MFVESEGIFDSSVLVFLVGGRERAATYVELRATKVQLPHARRGAYRCVMHGPLSLKIRKRLTDDVPFAYCDACLALRFNEALADARAAAMLVARDDGFMRKVRACYGCKRAVEMTEVRR